MQPGGRTPTDPTARFTIRRARPDDLPSCARIWRLALNDYFARLHLPLIPAESAGVARLHAHALAVDADRFVVAEPRGVAQAPTAIGQRRAEVSGFASALVRGRTWYLSMLFVHPAFQGAGLGRALLEHVLPPPGDRHRFNLALASDSAQPVSNGLYSSLGIVARLPVWNLVGRPTRAPLPGLPSGVSVKADDGGTGSDQEIGALDLAVLGFEHPEDHRFVRESGRDRFLYRASDGNLVGYGYASDVGHVGPVAVRDADLLTPILGHLLDAVQPRGASSVWIAGDASAAISHLVRAGLRLDGFPVLLGWSSPFADFGRYVPHSPGLL